jgi:hypothetical protein
MGTYLTASTNVPSMRVGIAIADNQEIDGLQILFRAGISTMSLLNQGASAPAIYSNEQGATVADMTATSNVGLEKLGSPPLTARGIGLCRLFAISGPDSSCDIEASCGTNTKTVTIAHNVGSGC